MSTPGSEGHAAAVHIGGLRKRAFSCCATLEAEGDCGGCGGGDDGGGGGGSGGDSRGGGGGGEVRGAGGGAHGCNGGGAIGGGIGGGHCGELSACTRVKLTAAINSTTTNITRERRQDT